MDIKGIDLFNVVASLASIVSLIFAAWIYHKEQLNKAREEVKVAVLKERLENNENQLRLTANYLQLLIRRADDINAPVPELQNMARGVRSSLMASIMKTESITRNLSDWKFGKILKSGTTKLKKKVKKQTLKKYNLEKYSMDYHTLFYDAFEAEYQVLKTMKGGMGKVDICKEINTNEFFAAKSLKSEFINSEHRIKTLIKESFIWASISGIPNVIMLNAIRFINNIPQLILEYGGHHNLRSFLNSYSIGLIQKVDIARQVAQGLKGMADIYPNAVHGDLSPSNILVDLRNLEWGGHLHKEMLINITDFGLSTIVGDPILGDTGNFFGQIPYISPERIKSQKINVQSDIYSFGIILYEIFTGQHPFYTKIKQEKDFIDCHLNYVPPNPKSLNPNLPDSICKIITKCIQKKGEHRFENFADIYHSFSRIFIEYVFVDKKKEMLLKSVDGGHIDGIDLYLSYLSPHILDKQFRYNRRAGILDKNAKFVASNPIRKNVLIARGKFVTGLSLLQNGQIAEGTKNILAANDLMHDSDMLIKIAEILISQGKYKEPITLALKALKHEPENQKIKNILVKCGQKLRDDPNFENGTSLL